MSGKISKHRTEAAGDPGIRRAVSDGQIIALVMKHANGKWGLYDTNGEKRLTGEVFAKPGDAAIWLDENRPGSGADAPSPSL